MFGFKWVKSIRQDDVEDVVSKASTTARGIGWYRGPGWYVSGRGSETLLVCPPYPVKNEGEDPSAVVVILYEEDPRSDLLRFFGLPEFDQHGTRIEENSLAQTIAEEWTESFRTSLNGRGNFNFEINDVDDMVKLAIASVLQGKTGEQTHKDEVNKIPSLDRAD